MLIRYYRIANVIICYSRSFYCYWFINNVCHMFTDKFIIEVNVINFIKGTKYNIHVNKFKESKMNY